jgi:hypothetical protein
VVEAQIQQAFDETRKALRALWDAPSVTVSGRTRVV